MIAKNKYIVYIIEATKYEQELKSKDFGNTEEHDGFDRTIKWISLEKFLNKPFKSLILFVIIISIRLSDNILISDPLFTNIFMNFEPSSIVLLVNGSLSFCFLSGNISKISFYTNLLYNSHQ